VRTLAPRSAPVDHAVQAERGSVVDVEVVLPG
jgi:hypothetical protein